MPTARELLLANSREAAKEMERLVRDEPERIGLELLRIAGDVQDPGLLRILALQRLSRWERDSGGAGFRKGLDTFVRGVEREFPSRRLDEIGAEARRCPWLREMWVLLFVARAILRLGHPAGLAFATAVDEALSGTVAEQSSRLLVGLYGAPGGTGGSPASQPPSRRTHGKPGPSCGPDTPGSRL